jgi:hypothetical protein
MAVLRDGGKQFGSGTKERNELGFWTQSLKSDESAPYADIVRREHHSRTV